MRTARLAALTTCLLLACAAPSYSADDCVFEITETTMRLVADCTTDTSIAIPDGMTLDGANFTITAVDPPGGHFIGGILVNLGATVSIVDTRLAALSLANICDTGDARLRGIFLNGASGVVRGNTILNVNQGPSACQEGNAIEVWNLSAVRVSVEIADNVVEGYQKSGIVASGDVDALIHHNRVGASATPATLPTNAVQVGFGAWGRIEANDITGNRWALADAAATGILLSGSAAGTTVRNNDISGNADVGIYVAADGAVVTGNRVVEEGPDGFYDIGIVSFGDGNVVRNNDVRGYEERFLGPGAGETSAPERLEVE